MPPTLFQKLFNKKHGLISPARDPRDDCVFRLNSRRSRLVEVAQDGGHSCQGT